MADEKSIPKDVTGLLSGIHEGLQGEHELAKQVNCAEEYAQRRLTEMMPDERKHYRSLPDRELLKLLEDEYYTTLGAESGHRPR